MTDDRIDELASAYLDGELDAAGVAEAEADRAVMARVERFSLLRARMVDVGPAPPLAEHRLAAVLTELTPPARHVQRQRWLSGLAATGVAAAVLAGVIVMAATNSGDDSTSSADTIAATAGKSSDTTGRQSASEAAQAAPDAASDLASGDTRSALVPSGAGATAAATATTTAAATTGPARPVPATVAAATTKGQSTTTVVASATTTASAGSIVPDLGEVNDVSELTARLAALTTTSPASATSTTAQPKPACATDVGATLHWRSQPAWLLVHPDRFDVIDAGCAVLASVARGAATTP